ncbi:MAG: hypothetical protein E7361_00300 [Clostridiales bacterium]|nr:hypothetical protein [Clostridiales bacterium]
MINYKDIIRRLVIILIVLYSGMVIGCNHSADDFVPNISWNYSVYTLTEGKSIALSDLITSDVSLDKIVFHTTNSGVVDINSNSIVAISAGEAMVKARYENVEVTMSIVVNSSAIYAKQIVAIDGLEMVVGERVKLDTLYYTKPDKLDVSESIIISSNLVVDNATSEIVAVMSGRGFVTIEIANSMTTKISKTIQVDVAKRGIEINARVVDLGGIEPMYIHAGYEYCIIVEGFAGYSIGSFTISDNVELVSEYDKANDKVLLVKFNDLNNIRIAYEDDYVVGEANVLCGAEYRDPSKYKIGLVDADGDIVTEADKYIFYITADGVDSPYAKTASLDIRYNGEKVNCANIEISGNAFRMDGDIVNVVSEGDAEISIKIGDYITKVNLWAEICVVKDVEIQYPKIHNLSDSNIIEIGIIKDREYNIFPDTPIIVPHDDTGVRVDGMNIIVESLAIRSVSGRVVIGDIIKEFNIVFSRYRIDDIIVNINMVSVGTDIIVSVADWYVLDIVFMYKGNEVVIDENVPLIATYTYRGNTIEVSFTRLLRLYITEDVSIGILDENMNVMFNINIRLKIVT